MALKFGEWLKGNTGLSDIDLSPIYNNLSGLAPLYLQAGGREILVDMIRDFAATAAQQGAEVTLDVWDNMTHDFQSFGDYLPESQAALRRIGSVVEHYCGEGCKQEALPRSPNTALQGTPRLSSAARP